jgi:hypothetical protein
MKLVSFDVIITPKLPKTDNVPVDVVAIVPTCNQ